MCTGSSIHFRLMNGYFWESVKVFETENISTQGATWIRNLRVHDAKQCIFFSLNQVEPCSLHVVPCSHSENTNMHRILQGSFQLQLVTKQIKFSVGGRLCSGKSLLFWDEKYTFSVDAHPGFSMSINLVAHLVIIIDVLNIMIMHPSFEFDIYYI